MKKLLNSTRRYLRRSIFHFRCSDFLKEKESGLYVEDYFHEVVYLERRRAERTGRAFVMMLVDFEGLLGGDGSEEMVRSVSGRLAATTREVDIKGWYRHNHVLGVVFTDTPSGAIGSIREKVMASLAEDDSLGGRAGHIKITFHPFPEETGSGKTLPVDFKLYPDLQRKKEIRKSSLAAKRVLDVAGSIFGLLLFSPFFIALPVVIKLTSRGPVFFRQERVGEFGKRFTFLKFRSMYEGVDDKTHSEYVKRLIREDRAYSEGAGRAVYKIQDDPRVTTIGKFLRKTSLDELPQFLNVLGGDMSLVGPRPPIPYELESYGVWHWRRVIEAKPGITGLWQVMGRSMKSYNDMVRLDLRYIEEWSLWLDIKIILRTPFSMVSSKGAY